MPRLVIDATLPQKLLECFEPAELCDGTGRVLGRFVPTLDRLQKRYDLGPEISDEELERRANSKERRYTTEEVLARLKELP